MNDDRVGFLDHHKLGVFFDLISYGAGFLCLLLLAAAIAVASMVLLELVEERISLAQRITGYIFWLVIIIHLLLIFNGFPAFESIWSIVSHFIYAFKIKDFPASNNYSPSSIASVICFVVSNYLWFNFFQEHHVDFIQIVGFFFLQVWLAPIILLGSIILAEVTMPIHLTEIDSNRKHTLIDSLSIQNVLSMLTTIKSFFQVLYSNKKD